MIEAMRDDVGARSDTAECFSGAVRIYAITVSSTWSS